MVEIGLFQTRAADQIFILIYKQINIQKQVSHLFFGFVCVCAMNVDVI